MSKRLLGAGTLAALLVLFFAINILSNTALRGARIDLTQDKLYTLSEGARAIARGIDEPISLTFYFSRSLAVDRPDLRGRAARVQEALEGRSGFGSFIPSLSARRRSRPPRRASRASP